MAWSWQKGEWSSNPKNREILIMGCNNLNNGGMTIPNYFEMVPQPVKVLEGRLSHPNLSKQIHFTYKNMAGKSANKNSMVHSYTGSVGFTGILGGGIPLLFTSICVVFHWRFARYHYLPRFKQRKEAEVGVSLNSQAVF